MFTFLIIFLVIATLAAVPSWPYSRGWGYYPSAGLSIILAVLLVLMLTGRV